MTAVATMWFILRVYTVCTRYTTAIQLDLRYSYGSTKPNLSSGVDPEFDKGAKLGNILYYRFRHYPSPCMHGSLLKVNIEIITVIFGLLHALIASYMDATNCCLYSYTDLNPPLSKLAISLVTKILAMLKI